ncbi:MAG: hypothetical protein EAZ77_10890 [Nostocales cyanobacterium]|nr:MAG: hypothetical protein EAZ77_10890 [Nostocales cyanobacterium]
MTNDFRIIFGEQTTFLRDFKKLKQIQSTSNSQTIYIDISIIRIFFRKNLDKIGNCATIFSVSVIYLAMLR